MSMCRRFNGEPVMRLIVSVPVDVVATVDGVIAGHWPNHHQAKGCRAEFVRLAISEKLARDKSNSAKLT